VEWLDRHGHEHLRWLVRHFSSPYVSEDGQLTVPPLTEWLFRQHEGDDEAFSAFLMGRHHFQVVTQGDVNPDRKRLEMQPFLAHPLRRVREWAQYEISSEERQAAEFRDFDEEDERL
jgi:hypothetical protein